MTTKLDDAVIGDVVRWEENDVAMYGMITRIECAAPMGQKPEMRWGVIGEYGSPDRLMTAADAEKLGAAIVSHRSPRLSDGDWVQISDLIASRLVDMEHWTSLRGSDQTTIWQSDHLRSILNKIGHHGELAAAFGVDPADGFARWSLLDWIEDMDPAEAIVEQERRREQHRRTMIAAERKPGPTGVSIPDDPAHN